MQTSAIPSLHASLNSSTPICSSTAQSGATIRCARTRSPHSLSSPHALSLLVPVLPSKWGKTRHLDGTCSRTAPDLTQASNSFTNRLSHCYTEAGARVGPAWLPSIYRPFIQAWCVNLYVRSSWPPPESRMPVMETAPDKSEWDAGALKGRMRGEVGEEFGGKPVCDLLNHHWKLIRKLAGPGGAGRTDCALPSTMPVMKWKLGGSVPGQISLH